MLLDAGGRATTSTWTVLVVVFEEAGPVFFNTTMALDATVDTFQLPMLGPGELDPHITLSGWHVMATSQTFTCGTDSNPQGQPKPLQLNTLERPRPNVALVSTESSYTIHNAVYELEQIRSFTALEEKGFRYATKWFSSHFDVDGLGANYSMIALRRQKLAGLLPNRLVPLVSARHCGNHIESIIEGYTLECISDEVFNLLAVSSSFFRMGGNFLRLVHTLDIDMGMNYKIPIVGAPPCQAVVAANELENYCIANYRCF